MESVTENKASKLLKSHVLNILIVTSVLFSVFGWDIAKGWLPGSADLYIELGMVICFLLFTFELILMVASDKKWYRSGVFWIYFIATLTMLFDIPHLVLFMTGPTTVVAAISNLRLIKILRVLARLGRLIRILKNFALGWIKNLTDRFFNRSHDKASVVQIKKIREKIAASDVSPSWNKMEATITSGIIVAFFLLFLPATIYLDKEISGLPAEKTFEYILENDGPLTDARLDVFLENYPEVLKVITQGEIRYQDQNRESLLRGNEIRRFVTSEGSLTLDTRHFTQSNSRLLTWVNLLMVLFSSILTVFIDWIISHYSLEISGTLKTLAHALDERDAYTRMHSRHVACYAVNTARLMGLGKKDLDIIKLAGELHDVGKIGVPEAILHKGGRLDDKEYTIMKRHPEQGARILDPLINLDQVILAVYHHHEKYDGTGYPEGLKGTDIPLIARILSVCDVWDALTTTRPYRKAMPFEKAKGIITSAIGTDFCPEVVEAFFQSEAWRLPDDVISPEEIS